MSTREIRTSTSVDICDVCGRTLLRGERAEIYVGGGARHSVCELCTSRALHDGWLREGEVSEYDEFNSRGERRRSLLRRRRGRRARPETPVDRQPPEALDREWAGTPVDREWTEVPVDREWTEVPVDRAPVDEPALEPGLDQEASPPRRSEPARRARSTSPWWPEPMSRVVGRSGHNGREPRHVRAVPTSVEHKISSAVSLFNGSEHPRTVAGIGRSLGIPDVAVYPADANGSIVKVVVAWELCWYRYEVDLSDEVPTVRVAAQGYELSELSEIELRNNAVADDRGRLEVGF